MTVTAPRSLVASDGRPSTLSDCAGGAKMHGSLSRAGRFSARLAYRHTKQSQAVTLFTMGRSARSGRGPVPANRRATPMVVGARARWSVDRALKRERKSRTRLSHTVHRTPRASDGIGRGLSGFLLPLLARARHLLMQEIFSQPARARQSSPRCMSDVFKIFRRFGVLTAFHGDETTMERHEACSKNPTMRFTA